MFWFTAAVWYVAQDLFRAAPPNVLLLTVAGLPDDLISAETTPPLADIANQGAIFTHHHALDGRIGSDFETLLTGFHPFAAAAPNDQQAGEEAGRYSPLAELVRAGYLVEGIQGFMQADRYRALGLEVPAADQDLLYRLSLHRHHRTPFILWYHYDRHQPPDRTEPAKDNDRFAGWLATFWDHFTRSGLQRNTILLLISGHLNEAGAPEIVESAPDARLMDPGKKPARPTLIVWLPDALENMISNETDRTYCPLDIMPSLFGLLDLPPAPGWQGRNLFATAE